MIFNSFPAWVALGANLGDAAESVEAAIHSLGQQAHCRVSARSSLYRTAPIGCDDQPDYINAVVALETSLGPQLLLETLLALEKRFGRVRSYRNAPRTLDLDLLMYADLVIDKPGICLPHPRMHERAFVLEPLFEIAPDLVVPGKGMVRELRAAVSGQAIERLTHSI